MTKKIDVGILGGDKRQIELINCLKKEGHNVFATGFDKALSKISVFDYNVMEMLENSEFLIFPIPISKDNIYFNTPFSDFKTPIINCIREMNHKKIFCFDSSKLLKICPDFKKYHYYDLAKDEKFLLGNAKITAECAIKLAKEEFNKTTFKDFKILICGFGRIGKYLTELLIKENAKLTVSARKQEDINKIERLKIKAIFTQNLKEYSGFDLIFNTIPYLIFDEKTLKSTANHSTIIDLASLPGGVDKISAEKLNIKLIHALALPGKMAPENSAELIKNTILNIIEENNL